MKLKLGTVLETGKPFTLPLSLVTQTLGILARKRAGKSNTAVAMAEEMFEAKLPWVAIDPKGDWWGIRAAGEGGPGLPVVIFGGEHADVPLEPGSGKFIADLIVDQRLTCVLDVSEMMVANKSACRRFLTDFAKRLYARNREPLMVFCEEADEYIPQMVRGDAAEMVGAFETLVKRGGFRGIGITLITQRSASLNKDVLTQIDTLIALQTTGPQDKDAIEAWITHHRLAKDVMKDIGDLKKGQAWVFSPTWLEVLIKVKFRKRETFDSGATPEIGKKMRPPSTLADVNIKDLTTKMAALIEHVKATDVPTLQKKIQQLERELALTKRMAVENPEVKVIEKKVEVLKPFLDEKLAEEMAASYRANFEGLMTRMMTQMAAQMDKESARLIAAAKKRVSAVPPAHIEAIRQGLGQRRGDPLSVPVSARAETVKKNVLASSPNGSSEISAAGQKILNAIGWMESIGVYTVARTTVGALSGYSAKSGHFKNTTGNLRSAGLINYPDSDSLALTEEGRAKAAVPDVPPTTEDLHAMLLSKLDVAQRRLLEPLLKARGQPVSREKLGEISGYSHNSGHFKNVLGSLRSMRVVEYPDAQTARASDLVFLN